MQCDIQRIHELPDHDRLSQIAEESNFDFPFSMLRGMALAESAMTGYTVALAVEIHPLCYHFK
jgi:hypothetical protein